MNEHEKLEAALNLVEVYAHRNGMNRIGGGKVCLSSMTDVMSGDLLANCGRFRIVERTARGELIGYWRDEDPERKAGK